LGAGGGLQVTIRLLIEAVEGPESVVEREVPGWLLTTEVVHCDFLIGLYNEEKTQTVNAIDSWEVDLPFRRRAVDLKRFPCH